MGKGKIQPSILFTDQLQNEIENYAAKYGRGLRLQLHPFVYAYVCKGWFTSLKAKWHRKYGVRVTENQSLGMLDRRFIGQDGKQLTDSEQKQ